MDYLVSFYIRIFYTNVPVGIVLKNIKGNFTADETLIDLTYWSMSLGAIGILHQELLFQEREKLFHSRRWIANGLATVTYKSDIDCGT